MKKKNLLFVAVAMVMAGCASDDMIGDNGATQSDNQVIGFNMSTPAMTRADQEGSTAAGTLGGMFIVWGEKGETALGANYTAIDANTVFKNYRVDYKANSANSTLSNTENWEYVGATSFGSKVTPTAPDKQTIKYWDMNADDYTFTAVSAPEEEINDKITIEKILEGSTVYEKGYKIGLKPGATAGSIYVADRVHLTKTNDIPSTINKMTENKYGGQVKFTFRNFMTKIRFGFYETVPGYTVTVKDVTFNKTANTSNFGVDGTGSFYSVPTTGTDAITYKVTYEDGNNSTENKAKINVDKTSATAANYMTFGTGIFGSALKTVSSDPTYDVAAYTSILPNPDNTSNISFKISYTLISEDTQEKIEVKDKDVTVPYQYCQWKNNYAYTYLFKISDKSTDLYPITFDACVVESETGKQETITEVGEPSITTFATTTDENNKKIYRTSANEYKANDVIYATILVNGEVQTLSKNDDTSGNIKLYTVSSTDSNFPVTEASVANAIASGTVTGAKITYSVETLTDANFVTTVPAEDGSDITLANSGKALTWTPTAAATYAIQYKGTDNKLYYKVVKVVK